MDQLQAILDRCQEKKWVPEHKCRWHKKVLVETHSVNSFHNIVIYRKSVCTICGKIFEQSDPDGIK